jgi:putative ABC transport system substrate-binding protein
VIEYRWAEGDYDRLPALAADLVDRRVDVIVAPGINAALAAKRATSAIPVVFSGVGDPVAAGLVASLARPGGNLTGNSNITIELMPKRLELVSELTPRAGIFALLMNPSNPSAERIIRDVQEAARAKGVQLPVLKAGTESGDRRRFRLPRPGACRRARRQPRSVLPQPTRPARGAGVTPCRSGDLRVP